MASRVSRLLSSVRRRYSLATCYTPLGKDKTIYLLLEGIKVLHESSAFC